MLRGRHRGLPVAIDRAILLPSELQEIDDEPLARTTHDNRRSSPHSESPHCDPLPNEDGLTSSKEGFEGRLKEDEKRSSNNDTLVGPATMMEDATVLP